MCQSATRHPVHERNDTKTQYKQYKTQKIQAHILPKHLHIQNTTHAHTHTLQNKLKQPQLFGAYFASGFK